MLRNCFSSEKKIKNVLNIEQILNFLFFFEVVSFSIFTSILTFAETMGSENKFVQIGNVISRRFRHDTRHKDPNRFLAKTARDGRTGKLVRNLL